MWSIGRSKKRAPKSLKSRHDERELFFWTAHEAIQLVALVVVTAYLVVALIEGRLHGIELLVRSL
jgi:hypothetical protein